MGNVMVGGMKPRLRGRTTCCALCNFTVFIELFSFSSRHMHRKEPINNSPWVASTVNFVYKNVPYKNIRYMGVWLAVFVCKIKNITVVEYP